MTGYGLIRIRIYRVLIGGNIFNPQYRGLTINFPILRTENSGNLLGKKALRIKRKMRHHFCTAPT